MVTSLRAVPLRRKLLLGGLALAVVAGVVAIPATSDTAYADIQAVRSSIIGSDGKDYWVENHVDTAAVDASREALADQGKRPEYLIVWAGDENVADTAVPDVKNLPGSLANTTEKVRNALPGPDFMAVVDATEGSPTYGKVVNTATVGPLVENEPHHMQYSWRKGDKIYAGGLFSAATYVFDVAKLPALSLSGISLPSQTLCGSVPDAYWVLDDGTAYGTYMGGPVVPGPCTYSHGEVRTGNGFAGTPGEVVRFAPDGKNLVEAPAATTTAEDPKQCLDMPALSVPSCANPHGIQVREDLDAMVTSDYAEPRTIILDPVKAPSPYLRRPTVRTWDISDLNHPKVKSVSYLPEGPRSTDTDPLHNENRAVMETTVTNLPGHKGAFAMTMQGGAIFYTADITATNPVWREVFDNTAAMRLIDPAVTNGGPSDNGGWLQTSPDDTKLYHAVIGRKPGALGKDDPGTAGGVFSLDISKLVEAGDDFDCSIETTAEIADGGAGADCPTVAGHVAINPGSKAAGPHWGALDNLAIGDDGYYHVTDRPARLATADYFVARTGLDGDHRVCIIDQDEDGSLSLDTTFRDEISGRPCINFNRTTWPHGAFGNAKPHSMLFVTADDDIK
ncbi:selenium-binding family protein [Pseudonocardia dioxanivorans]|uniref:selenium-binding family protein n=1 Tax=Pseudonocardia dioxanivorans TaxID=240495 RepID=UPI001F3411FB|nr:selenium-binding family protein [Pseudonocardia dioxanivorans]